METLYKPHQNIMREKEPSVMKAPPTYHIQFPLNVFSILDEKEIEQDIKHDKCFNFWTDGSCQPNPGPGGAGYYSNNFAIKEKIYVVDHDTTINYTELIGVKMVLSSVLRYIEFLKGLKRKVNKTNVNIHTDSQFVYRMMNKDGYPKLDYIYKLLQVIFDLCHKLGNYNININIIKVSSHKGNYGNQMADQLAKSAANLAKMCKYGESKFIRYELRKNAVNVDIAKDLIKLRKLWKKQRKSEWINMKNDRINNNNMNRYYGCHNFEKLMIDCNNNVCNKYKDMRKELEHLTQRECEIITKLRTEHINLNHYLYTMGIVNDYNCKWCVKPQIIVPETVDHFLLDCGGCQNNMLGSLHKNNVPYDVLRCKLRRDLKKITPFFKCPSNFTVQNILFPHSWQRRIHGTNKKKNWDRDGTYYRVKILKAVVKFVNNTKRFKNDYGI